MSGPKGATLGYSVNGPEVILNHFVTWNTLMENTEHCLFQSTELLHSKEHNHSSKEAAYRMLKFVWLAHLTMGE